MMLLSRTAKSAHRWTVCAENFGHRRGFRNYFNMFAIYMSRFPKKMFVDRIRGETVIIRPNTSDAAVYRQIFVEKEYSTVEFPEHHARIEARYREILSNGLLPLIIDCGANIGLSSVYYQLAYPKSRVIAVEPNASNCHTLSKNIRSFPNVSLIQAAVWDCITTVEVLDSNAESWGFQFVETDTSRGITTVTIDQILRDNSDTVPFIIKIDIEGGEQNLFRSDTDWMERFKVIVIEMHDWLLPFQDTSRNALRALSRSGRDYLHKGENTFWIQR